MTYVIAIVIDADIHYSTVMMATRENTSEHDVRVTDDDSFDSEQDHETHPRRRSDNRRRSKQNNHEFPRPTNFY